MYSKVTSSIPEKAPTDSSDSLTKLYDFVGPYDRAVTTQIAKSEKSTPPKFDMTISAKNSPTS